MCFEKIPDRFMEQNSDKYFDCVVGKGSTYVRSSEFDGEGGNIGYVDGSVRWLPGNYSAGSGPLKDVPPEDWVRE